MKIHEIPYVPREIPVVPSEDRSKSFEEELRKHMRGQVKTNENSRIYRGSVQNAKEVYRRYVL